MIDSETGAVSTTNSLDREKRFNYTLLIKAADQGYVPLTSTATLSINLSDENDNNPTFGQTSYRAIVSEDLPVGSEILRLSARDPDEGLNAEITFALIEETPGTFSVDASTGAVHLMKPLDRETQWQYSLRAVATDGCTRGPRSSVVTVSVQVKDVNDNVPHCITNPISTSISAGDNRTVAMVTAHDPDRGENGTVVFRLMEEDEEFQIDPSTGEVQMKSQMTASASGTKMLKILAIDKGSPALTSTCLVIITLNGDEPLLQFTDKHYEVSLPENSKTGNGLFIQQFILAVYVLNNILNIVLFQTIFCHKGTWVGNVAAHDQSATDVTVMYSIFSGNENGAFGIDSNTGETEPTNACVPRLVLPLVTNEPNNVLCIDVEQF